MPKSTALFRPSPTSKGNTLALATLVACVLIAAGCNTVPLPIGSSGTIYGDGSDGPLVVGINTVLASGNKQFTSVTINAGVKLAVESGAVIRCTGAFTNNGTVEVREGALGSTRNSGNINTTVDPTLEFPSSGVALIAAGTGELGTNVGICRRGEGGVGLNAAQAGYVLHPGATAGGAGAGGVSGFGGNGGGAVTILAKTSIVNSGTGKMTANAGDGLAKGYGGGAGGIIILASSGTITNNGLITCNGSAGGDSSNFTGPGGGGSGGIVHLLAPSIVGVGTISVAAGAGGVTGGVGSVTSIPREGGAGGGACGGNGGDGGEVSITGTPSAPTAATVGTILQETTDPDLLF